MPLADLGPFNLRWTTADEKRFINALALRRPALAARYCRLVLHQPRSWDPTVNVTQVKAHCEVTIARLAAQVPLFDGNHPAALMEAFQQ